MVSPQRKQKEVANALSIKSPTVTHHLNALETAGLTTWEWVPGNRREHQVALTEAGVDAFHRMRTVALQHDERLRAGFSKEEVSVLRDLLGRLENSVQPPSATVLPHSGDSAEPQLG